MKIMNQRDIASFFSKDPSAPNPHRSQTKFSPPINNPSTQELDNNPKKKRDET